MLRFVHEKITQEDFLEAQKDIPEYIKFVIDIKKQIGTIGGARHIDGEQLLLEKGSNQSDLWGGGIDLLSGVIDYDSMINIRPSDNNPNRVVLSTEIQSQINKILEKFDLWTHLPHPN